MKTSFLNLFIICFISVILISFSFSACNKNQKQSVQSTMASTDASVSFSKTTGKIFPRDTIAKWMANYNKANRINANPCVFKSEDIRSLCSGSDAAGIMFNNISINNNGEMVAIAINTLGELVKTDSVISSAGKISWLQAMEMINKYRAANPNGNWGEFFGSTTIIKLIASQNIQNLQVQLGINSNGTRLILTNADSSSGDPGGGVEEGQGCPPYCR